MKKVVFLFWAIGIIYSCGSGNYLTQTDKEAQNKNKYSFLALGDSYTIGEGVSEDQRWPVQLAKSLRERGYQMAPPKIIAQTGWTTGNLYNAMESELNYTREFDLVSILIGVNNQYQEKSKEEYEEDLRTIFKMALNYSKRRNTGVFALSIPDYSVTPFAEGNSDKISQEINEFNAIFKEVAEEFEVDYYNITPLSREAGRDEELITQDGLHPSGLMYRYWVEKIIEEVTQKLPN